MTKTAAKYRGKGSPTYTAVTTMNVDWRPGRAFSPNLIEKFPRNITPDQVLARMKKIKEEISALV